MKILIIEDSDRLRATLSTALRKSGYAVDAAADGEEGLWMAESGAYQVVILDLMLPKLDGRAVLERLRAAGNSVHVLILTAKDAVEDRVAGLEAGADDYLTKPFSLDELLARVGALMRRSCGQKSSQLQIGSLRVDLNRHEAFVDEQLLLLAPREYRLLELFALAKDSVLSRAEIEEHLYEDAVELFSNVVDSAVSSLRRKLSASGCSARIITKRGIGYMLSEESE
jgi:DNA-binding response OmpR family regulator